MSRHLSDKLEMYLKTILVLERAYSPVRVNQIAKERGVSAASVTEAIGTLQERGLILHKAYQGVRLSAEGRRVAERILNRYEVLRHFLTDVLGVEESTGRRDACEIEHVASPETMDRLEAFLKYVDHCRLNVSEVISHFKDYYVLKSRGDACERCEIGKIANPPSGRAQ
ncbi:MAG TPA: metal-dependent transcriptional regulator [Candidatus Krumholzibacteria bacterium]|nr:metal-dependent transcriptional regulator [Candidatus Krumholzibacteria bacterium]